MASYRESGLSAREIFFLFKVVGLVALIRLGLWLAPFRVVRTWLDRIGQPKAKMTGSSLHTCARRTAWAIKMASVVVPRATCLTQALAAHTMLQRQGHPAELCIGVVKDHESRLLAHAWVECDGEVIVGGQESLLLYAPFPSFDGK
jgi:hypothetical protein